MSLSLRWEKEAMAIDWLLPVALSFADTLTMCWETITAVSIVQDEQSNVSTHLSWPSPIPYNPILACKRAP